MDCEEFLTEYSDFLDRRFEVHPLSSYCKHLLNCPSCAEYDRVMRRGLSVIRELDPPQTARDLASRFRGPLQPVAAEVPGQAEWSAGRTVAGLAAGALIAVSALVLVGPNGEPVELPPVVVERAEASVPRASLWGPAPRFTPTVNLLQVPEPGRDPFLAPPSEPFSLFRAPLRTSTTTNTETAPE